MPTEIKTREDLMKFLEQLQSDNAELREMVDALSTGNGNSEGDGNTEDDEKNKTGSGDTEDDKTHVKEPTEEEIDEIAKLLEEE